MTRTDSPTAGHPLKFGHADNILGEFLDERSFSSLHILCDTNTAEACLPLLDGVGWPGEPQVIVMKHGETAKNLDTCRIVWDQLARGGADRSSLFICLGGGVVTDLGGFCAACFMRGMAFIHIPTSVLGMTDAAIGGKVGVDLGAYKNYIGAFSMPELVIIDTRFLQSLAKREQRNGLAEVIKHGILHDPVLLDMLDSDHGLEQIDWQGLLQRSVAVKEYFVQDDPLEKGKRTALNFGHTVGHAIESLSMHDTAPLHHGEAIALGMLVESKVSRELLGLPEEDLARIEHMMGMWFGDITWPHHQPSRVREMILKDKKKAGADVLYALIAGIGQPQTGQKVPDRILNGAYLHYASRP